MMTPYTRRRLPDGTWVTVREDAPVPAIVRDMEYDRKRFEEWARPRLVLLTRDRRGGYTSARTQLAWFAYLAGMQAGYNK